MGFTELNPENETDAGGGAWFWRGFWVDWVGNSRPILDQPRLYMRLSIIAMPRIAPSCSTSSTKVASCPSRDEISSKSDALTRPPKNKIASSGSHCRDVQINPSACGKLL